MYKLPQRKLRKDLGIAALANYKEQLPRIYVGWLSANFFQQLTNWSLTSHHQKWNVKIMMMNCHPRVLWFWPTEFLGAVLCSTLSLWIMSRPPSWQKQSQSLRVHSQVGGWGGGGLLQISSGGDDRRIFLGLKFLILGFFWVGLEVFFWVDWLYQGFFWVLIQTIWIFVVVPMYPGN